MHIVALIAIEGAPIFEMAVPAEVFGIDRPDLVNPWYELRVCGPRPGPVNLAGGFSIDVGHGLEALRAADTVIVPACGNIHDDPSTALVDALRAAYARGARIAAICSGAFVLAAAGILDGRRATTHWMHADALKRRYPTVDVDASVLYVQDDKVFTSAGTAAGLDLCLDLVRQDYGSAVANRLARRLVIPPHRAGGQAQYVETSVPVSTDRFSALLDWAITHLDEPLSLADLAAAGQTSMRTLARRFHGAVGMSPMRWLVAQRIRRARELLETTDEPIERVSDLVGFGRPSSLREQFSREMGVSPLAYRRTFRATDLDTSVSAMAVARGRRT